MTSSVTNPLILIFDLDETLYCLDRKSNTLSQSASKTLSRQNSKGHLKDIVINKEYSTECLKAIDRKSFENIFKKINQINSCYIKKPILVNILTANEIGLDEIKNVFNRLYAEENEDLYSSLGIELFNYWDIKLANNSKSINTHVRVKNRLVSLEKANLMIKKFNENWHIEYPTLEKNRIYLVDNTDVLTEGAKHLGFNALLWPATVDTRKETAVTPTGETIFKEAEFTTGREKVINEIHRLIDSVKL